MVAATNLTNTSGTAFLVMNKTAITGGAYYTPFRPDKLQILTEMATAGDVWGCWEGAEVSSGIQMTSTFRIIAMTQRAANDVDLWDNGTKTNYTSGVALPTAAGATTIGNNLDNGTQGINGDIAQALYYNTALSDANVKLVGNYLYGIYAVGSAW